MGMRTDVLIADREEAQALVENEELAKESEGFAFKGFDHVQLCTLLSLRKAGGPMLAFEQYNDQIDVIRSPTGDLPCVAVIPHGLVDETAAVAGLDDSEFESLAASWGATEEFAGWTPEDVRELLRELGDLAERASLEGKCLMILRSD